MRNEQSACYAAQAIGYLTGQPGTYKFAFLLLIFISCLQWSTEPKQDSVIFGFRFGSVRFVSVFSEKPNRISTG